MIERFYDLPGPGHLSGQPKAVRCGDFVFFAAMRGVNEDGSISDDPHVQATRLLEILRAQLEALGLSPANVVKAGIYLKDMHRTRPILNKVWAAEFGDEQPVRFAVEVSDMGGEGDSTLILMEVVAYHTSTPSSGETSRRPSAQ
ncbi:RidA family protein [Streptosporangium sp. NPDC050280]|uniref:RidA family protein n=1 Tax=unclassified Streptosporangium TaxID=2632669 RepID=UPI00342FA5F5